MMAARIAIVGGGFSGVAVAWQLLQRMQAPAMVHLVNRGPLGRGLAYGSPSPHHLLNVPAGRMGIDPADEAGFVHYLRGIGLPFAGSDFVPRTLYGAYLEWCLGDARAQAQARGVQLQIHDGAVTGIEPHVGGFALHLSAAPGARVEADSVVLALGNFASVPPALQPGFDWQGPGLHLSPWTARRLAPEDLNAPVLLLGSGLTAYDALLQLRHEGHRGPVTMLSRRGLRAQPHRPLETPPPQGIVSPDVLAAEGSLRSMLQQVRGAVKAAQTSGLDWRDVIGGLRPATPRLWAQLAPDERRRFLRHVLPYWDTHRHRAAVPIAQRIEAERQAGSLVSMAGRLRGLTPVPGGWRADIEARGSGGLRSMQVSSVVNCTGPSSDVRRVDDALLAGLLAQGRLRPDALGLGLEVDAQYRLLDTAGVPQPRLRYVGPLLKAGYWEATAVPELRAHAHAVAKAMTAEVAGVTGRLERS